MMWRISGLLASLAMLFSSTARAAEPRESTSLPPVPVAELTAQAPQPSWDTGLVAAVCGVGESQIWQDTKFCMGALVDGFWGRKQATDRAFGGYAQVGTAGFRDVRLSVGGAFLQPLGDWFTAELRVGPLMRIEEYPAFGAQGSVELGQRSFSYKSSYSL